MGERADAWTLLLLLLLYCTQQEQKQQGRCFVHAAGGASAVTCHVTAPRLPYPTPPYLPLACSIALGIIFIMFNRTSILKLVYFVVRAALATRAEKTRSAAHARALREAHAVTEAVRLVHMHGPDGVSDTVKTTLLMAAATAASEEAAAAGTGAGVDPAASPASSRAGTGSGTAHALFVGGSTLTGTGTGDDVFASHLAAIDAGRETPEEVAARLAAAAPPQPPAASVLAASPRTGRPPLATGAGRALSLRVGGADDPLTLAAALASVRNTSVVYDASIAMGVVPSAGSGGGAGGSAAPLLPSPGAFPGAAASSPLASPGSSTAAAAPPPPSAITRSLSVRMRQPPLAPGSAGGGGSVRVPSDVSSGGASVTASDGPTYELALAPEVFALPAAYGLLQGDDHHDGDEGDGLHGNRGTAAAGGATASRAPSGAGYAALGDGTGAGSDSGSSGIRGVFSAIGRSLSSMALVGGGAASSAGAGGDGDSGIRGSINGGASASSGHRTSPAAISMTTLVNRGANSSASGSGDGKTKAASSTDGGADAGSSGLRQRATAAGAASIASSASSASPRYDASIVAAARAALAAEEAEPANSDDDGSDDEEEDVGAERRDDLAHDLTRIRAPPPTRAGAPATSVPAPASTWRQRLYNWLTDSIAAINNSPVVYFAKQPDLTTLNKAILYVRANETTSRIVVVHVVDDRAAVAQLLEEWRCDVETGGTPPNVATILARLPPMPPSARLLRDNCALLDAMYPKLRIDCLVVRGSYFSPPVVNFLSEWQASGHGCMHTMPPPRLPSSHTALLVVVAVTYACRRVPGRDSQPDVYGHARPAVPAPLRQPGRRARHHAPAQPQAAHARHAAPAPRVAGHGCRWHGRGGRRARQGWGWGWRGQHHRPLVSRCIQAHGGAVTLSDAPRRPSRVCDAMPCPDHTLPRWPSQPLSLLTTTNGTHYGNSRRAAVALGRALIQLLNLTLTTAQTPQVLGEIESELK